MITGNDANFEKTLDEFSKIEADPNKNVDEQEVRESYGDGDIRVDMEQGLSKEEIIGNIRSRYFDIGDEQAQQIYNAVKTGGKADWSHREPDSNENVDEEEVIEEPEEEVKERDVIVRIVGGKHEGNIGVVANWVKGLGYQDVRFGEKEVQIEYDYLEVGEIEFFKSPEEFEEERPAEESKTNEQEEVKEEEEYDPDLDKDTVRQLEDAWALIGAHDPDASVRSTANRKIGELAKRRSSFAEESKTDEE